MDTRKSPVEKALEGFTTAQCDKAAELITDGGLVPSGRPGVWRVSGSGGNVTYFTDSAVCTCPAGQHGNRCYHLAAVRVVEAVAMTERQRKAA